MEKVLRRRNDLHLIRKLWHMSTGLMGYTIVVSYNLNLEIVGLGLVAFALLGFGLEFFRLRNEKINRSVIKLMGPLMRKNEQNGCSGLPFYALGVGASLLLFEREAALLSILFLVFADPISSFFGILYGKNRLVQGKSLEGSAAGFLTCYLITFLWLQSSGMTGTEVLTFSLFAGIMGALSELFSIFADDNLTIPLASGAGLTLINALIPILY